MAVRRTFLFTLAVLLLGGASASWSQSVNMCIDKCFGDFSEEARQGRTALRDMCLARCQNNGGGSRESFGAIAYDRMSGAWGYSDHFANRGRAEGAAMQRCQERGSGCEVMVWFDRRCGAVSSAVGQQAYWGLGTSDAQARARAMSSCSAAGGRECEIQVHHCSF